MKNNKYIKTNYSITIEVARSPQEVFNHLINDVSKFWPEEFEGECCSLNDEFVLKTGDSHYSKNKVVELVPDKKVVWLVTDSIRKADNYNWTGTKMIFELTSKSNKTVLQFTYDGAVLENESERLAQICDFVIKENLYNLITHGKLLKQIKMENKNYHRTITVNASATEAMKKISEVNCWWKKDFSGSAEKLNDIFTVPFGEPSFVDFVVSEIIPGKKAVWKVTDCYLPWFNDKKEWNNTEVVFELSEADGKTQIDFTHVGLVPEVECYNVCEKGWDGHVTESLVKFINEGKTI